MKLVSHVTMTERGWRDIDWDVVGFAVRNHKRRAEAAGYTPVGPVTISEVPDARTIVVESDTAVAWEAP